MEDNVSNVKEFNIPVPWGHIAAKAWGSETLPPVLVFHGRMDNAGSFDNLIPLLPSSFQYICFDLPGHGKSSHFPLHVPLYSPNYLIAYTLIMRYFRRKSYIILGHSYGAHLGLLYSRLYSSNVEKLIMIDTIHTDVVPATDFKNYLVNRLDAHLRYTEKMSSGKQPKYTYEEAKERLMKSRETDPLTEKAAVALLNRGLKPVGDGKYTFMLDQRMKHYMDMLHDFRYAIQSLKQDPVTCPVLMVLAKKNQRQTDAFRPIVKVLETQDNVSINYVDGGHDVHNNKPEVVAPYIINFMLKKFEEVKTSSIRTTSLLNTASRLLKTLKL